MALSVLVAGTNSVSHGDKGSVLQTQRFQMPDSEEQERTAHKGNLHRT